MNFSEKTFVSFLWLVISLRKKKQQKKRETLKRKSGVESSFIFLIFLSSLLILNLDSNCSVFKRRFQSKRQGWQRRQHRKLWMKLDLKLLVVQKCAESTVFTWNELVCRFQFFESPFNLISIEEGSSDVRKSLALHCFRKSHDSWVKPKVPPLQNVTYFIIHNEVAFGRRTLISQHLSNLWIKKARARSKYQ